MTITVNVILDDGRAVILNPKHWAEIDIWKEQHGETFDGHKIVKIVAIEGDVTNDGA